jgi:CBS domain-containing protein
MPSQNKVSDLVESCDSIKNLVAVTETTPIEEVYRILLENKIQSCPVYQQIGNSRSFKFIVTLFDLLYYIVFQPVFGVSGRKSVTSPVNIPLKEQTDILRKPVSFIKLSENSKIWIFLPEESISNIIRVFKNGVKRGLVIEGEVDNSSNVSINIEFEKIVTQTDIIKFLFRDKSNPVFQKSIQQVRETFGKSFEPVVIHDTTFALTGFKKIYVNKVDSLAVVSDRGSIVGSLSPSDLKLLNRRNLDVVLFILTKGFTKARTSIPLFSKWSKCFK